MYHVIDHNCELLMNNGQSLKKVIRVCEIHVWNVKFFIQGMRAGLGFKRCVDSRWELLLSSRYVVLRKEMAEIQSVFFADERNNF